MRKFIIDTDIGSDDAVAVIMALKQKDVDVLGITAVAGNCDIDNVVRNALMTIEVVIRQKPPVYKGHPHLLYGQRWTRLMFTEKTVW